MLFYFIEDNYLIWSLSLQHVYLSLKTISLTTYLLSLFSNEFCCLSLDSAPCSTDVASLKHIHAHIHTTFWAQNILLRRGLFFFILPTSLLKCVNNCFIKFPDILQYYLRCNSGQVNPFQQVTCTSSSNSFFLFFVFKDNRRIFGYYMSRPKATEQLKSEECLCVRVLPYLRLCAFCRGFQGVTKHWWRCRMMWQSYWDQQHVIMPTPRFVRCSDL